jgi:hypothetical protein
MRTLLFLTLFLGFNASSVAAQSPCRQPDEIRGDGEGTSTAATFAAAKSPAANSHRTREQSAADQMLSKMNKEVIRQFEIAWRRSCNGTLGTEGLVLIFRNPDGSYRAEEKGRTNQIRKFSFKWDPYAIAIVHTHPNDRDPQPHELDVQLADRLGVLMFTITLQGMFMYDPATKRITQVKKGLDWLEPSMWTQDSGLALNQ